MKKIDIIAIIAILLIGGMPVSGISRASKSSKVGDGKNLKNNTKTEKRKLSDEQIDRLYKLVRKLDPKEAKKARSVLDNIITEEGYVDINKAKKKIDSSPDVSDIKPDGKNKKVVSNFRRINSELPRQKNNSSLDFVSKDIEIETYSPKDGDDGVSTLSDSTDEGIYTPGSKPGKDFHYSGTELEGGGFQTTDASVNLDSGSVATLAQSTGYGVSQAVSYHGIYFDVDMHGASEAWISAEAKLKLVSGTQKFLTGVAGTNKVFEKKNWGGWDKSSIDHPFGWDDIIGYTCYIASPAMSGAPSTIAEAIKWLGRLNDAYTLISRLLDKGADTYTIDVYKKISEGGTFAFSAGVESRAVGFMGYGKATCSGMLQNIDISVYGNSDDGGGCPYVSPYNGTEYARDNNILVQSEFKDGKVTDYYKLDNNLAKKNGNYSVKIEEFENSEDFIDQMKLYTIDHKDSSEIGVTPKGEYLTYKNSDSPDKAYTSNGKDILNKVKNKEDEKRVKMKPGSQIYLEYRDKSLSNWKHKKLILRSSGFSSYTTKTDEYGTMAWKTSLYVELKIGNSEWNNVTCIHPRNNPHDYVIPLKDTIHEMLKEEHDFEGIQVRIKSTKNHKIDYVGLDDSRPSPTFVQEADLKEVIKTNLTGKSIEKTGSLRRNDSLVVNLVPGEECTVKFEIPEIYANNVLEERDFILMVKGEYIKYG